MDPNETLRTIRDLIANPGNTVEDNADSFEQLSYHVEALDEWLSRGGFLPESWQRAK